MAALGSHYAEYRKRVPMLIPGYASATLTSSTLTQWWGDRCPGPRVARRQAARGLRVLGDLGLSRRGRRAGLVRHLRPRPRDPQGPRERARARQLGGGGRDRRCRTHQGGRLQVAHLLHRVQRGGQGSAARGRLRVDAGHPPDLGVRAAARIDHGAVVAALRHRRRIAAFR